MDRPKFDGLDDFLEHFGVKGMRWGVRRANPSAGPEKIEIQADPGRRVKARGGSNRPASEDAVRAVALGQRAKKSSVHSLSNKELQDLVTRMNLEKQYSNLKGDTAFKKGVAITRDLLNAGKLGKEVFDTVKKVSGK